jgi:hypothetical protein
MRRVIDFEPRKAYKRGVVFFVPFQAKFAGVAQLIERRLAKAKVAGLNPVSRSNLSIFFNNVSLDTQTNVSMEADKRLLRQVCFHVLP